MVWISSTICPTSSAEAASAEMVSSASPVATVASRASSLDEAA
jgi:hypothetical protein